MEREERARLLAEEADRIVEALIRKGATLVVAFGSFGRGDVGRASDLDLIAVMESDLPFIRRLERLYEELAPRVGLDLLVYTPEEFAEVRGRAFIRRALDEGRVLHAA
ncbi:MAG TPA: nucleotidyltransferase domain-containing protein [Actinomycetota bacterium]|nr:nucleotidyltransferase domain-containing protein [Actinomycetota bacterium]